MATGYRNLLPSDIQARPPFIYDGRTPFDLRRVDRDGRLDDATVAMLKHLYYLGELNGRKDKLMRRASLSDFQYVFDVKGVIRRCRPQFGYPAIDMHGYILMMGEGNSYRQMCGSGPMGTPSQWSIENIHTAPGYQTWARSLFPAVIDNAFVQPAPKQITHAPSKNIKSLRNTGPQQLTGIMGVLVPVTSVPPQTPSAYNPQHGNQYQDPYSYQQLTGTVAQQTEASPPFQRTAAANPQDSQQYQNHPHQHLPNNPNNASQLKLEPLSTSSNISETAGPILGQNELQHASYPPFNFQQIQERHDNRAAQDPYREPSRPSQSINRGIIANVPSDGRLVDRTMIDAWVRRGISEIGFRISSPSERIGYLNEFQFNATEAIRTIVGDAMMQEQRALDAWDRPPYQGGVGSSPSFQRSTKSESQPAAGQTNGMHEHKNFITDQEIEDDVALAAAAALNGVGVSSHVDLPYEGHSMHSGHNGQRGQNNGYGWKLAPGATLTPFPSGQSASTHVLYEQARYGGYNTGISSSGHVDPVQPSQPICRVIAPKTLPSTEPLIPFSPSAVVDPKTEDDAEHSVVEDDLGLDFPSSKRRRY